MGKPTGFLEIERQVSTEVEPLNVLRTLMNFINHYLVMNNHAKELAAWIVEFLSVKMEK